MKCSKFWRITLVLTMLCGAALACPAPINIQITPKSTCVGKKSVVSYDVDPGDPNFLITRTEVITTTSPPAGGTASEDGMDVTWNAPGVHIVSITVKITSTDGNETVTKEETAKHVVVVCLLTLGGPGTVCIGPSSFDAKFTAGVLCRTPDPECAGVTWEIVNGTRASAEIVDKNGCVVTVKGVRASENENDLVTVIAKYRDHCSKAVQAIVLSCKEGEGLNITPKPYAWTVRTHEVPIKMKEITSATWENWLGFGLSRLAKPVAVDFHRKHRLHCCPAKGVYKYDSKRIRGGILYQYSQPFGLKGAIKEKIEEWVGKIPGPLWDHVAEKISEQLELEEEKWGIRVIGSANEHRSTERADCHGCPAPPAPVPNDTGKDALTLVASAPNFSVKIDFGGVKFSAVVRSFDASGRLRWAGKNVAVSQDVGLNTQTVFADLAGQTRIRLGPFDPIKEPWTWTPYSTPPAEKEICYPRDVCVPR